MSSCLRGMATLAIDTTEPALLAESSLLPLDLLQICVTEAIGTGSRLVSRELRKLHDASRRTLYFLCDVPASVIRSLVFACPRVEEVSLRGCAATVDDALLAFVLANLPDLCSLDLSECCKLTPQKSLRALIAFGEQMTALGEPAIWKADGCFVHPSALLTPKQVVINQVIALAQNTEDGIETCFRFASPSNREQTGPLKHFSHMIRRNYSIMLLADEVWVGVELLPVTGHKQPVVRCPVVYEGHTYDGRQLLMLMVFELELQSAEHGGEYSGCWMTNAVRSSGTIRARDKDQMMSERRIERVFSRHAGPGRGRGPGRLYKFANEAVALPVINVD